MDPLPKFIDSWIVNRTGERHYLCRLCDNEHGDHGTEYAFRLHLNSRSHMFKIRQMEQLYCKTCSLQFKFPSHYKKHIESKAHKWKEHPNYTPKLKCDVCDTTFSCKSEQQKHLETKKHAKNLQPKDTSKYHCEACNLCCKCLSHYEKHLTTAKHAKNVAKTDSCVPNPTESVPAIDT